MRTTQDLLRPVFNIPEGDVASVVKDTKIYITNYGISLRVHNTAVNLNNHEE